MDSTSEECKDVYAHFGLAMYLAQCVEQSIIQLLIFFDFFDKNAQHWESEEKWAADFDIFESAVSKKTMGRLIGSLKNLDNFGQLLDEDLEGLLGEALDKRNWLAHAYFSDRASHFVHSSGRVEMVAELEEARGLFKSVEDKLNPITYALTEKYGLTESMVQELASKMKELGKPEITDEEFKKMLRGVRGNL
ncbi:MAG TPA: hypothetical protein VL987_03860 [Cellvibrio sp.]|nr:hypothetical protein [Cellvibrio sp.]